MGKMGQFCPKSKAIGLVFWPILTKNQETSYLVRRSAGFRGRRYVRKMIFRSDISLEFCMPHFVSMVYNCE